MPFNLGGSDAAIISEHVEVRIDGSALVTVDVPGVDPNGSPAVNTTLYLPTVNLHPDQKAADLGAV